MASKRTPCEEVLYKLSEFLQGSSFEEKLTRFMNTNSCRLQITNVCEEHRHETYVEYNQFLELIENTLQDFKNKYCVGDKEVVDAFKQALSEGEELSKYVSLLLESWSFNAFMQFSNAFLLESEEESDTSSEELDKSDD
mmetsp:Transcript_10104/g.24085  ORF Transcript_10104/g.24085 Transcript_10104/m.24085 type:complete len:139 (+) Transcript_10104:175-591(+)